MEQMTRDNPVIDFSSPYLTHQIIPYIGNKRRLLPLLARAFERFGGLQGKGKRFADLFSGSGIVSRFARSLGYEVHANDWELYSYVINFAYITIGKHELQGMYEKWEGIEGILYYLNNIESLPPEDEFISRYYSPRSDDTPDYRKERLFYTRYNALKIDKIRSGIEKIYPEKEIAQDSLKKKEKYLLLALLLYEAATHTNTSGVFKAFHKGFGGHSGDALSRILKPIRLPYPVLVDSESAGIVYHDDANRLVLNEDFAKRQFEIVYCDPPYNQHQYGSNYHLLNTIVKWDKEYVSGMLDSNEFSQKKGGIRDDWTITRSAYCYRESACDAFEHLLSNIHSSYIFVSYSTEGIIPFYRLITICRRYGKIELISNEYVKYRGGRQSIQRQNYNLEFVIVIDTGKRSTSQDIQKVKLHRLKRELAIQLKRRYCISRLKKHFQINRDSDLIGILLAGETLWVETEGFFRIVPSSFNKAILRVQESKQIQYNELKRVLISLRECQCQNRVEELEEIIRLIEIHHPNAVRFLKELPKVFRKMAHKKYRKVFDNYSKKIEVICKKYPNYARIIDKEIQEIKLLAFRRFSG